MKSKNNLNLSHCCFDLDGTLVDSNKTIYEATAHTLNKLNINFNIDEELFATKIGQHFNDIFNAFNIDVPSFDEFINIYKANYFEQMHYSTLYDGVEETLAALKNKNIKISLLTTKVQDQADKILEYFNLTKYFDLIMGRRDGIAHKPSPEPLLKICSDVNVDVKNTLMIGDTELDIQCGKNAGSNTCGVLYGYRTKELLEIEKPDFIVGSINDILTIL
ncbi:MAG TPA: HAD-IA family hydrolase [Ignavibacteriaceae bacterium]|nr:HAD-IA family hydrolase [Ignavibacterium sp.]HMN25208.1 HAD-IA family hydrolase [Ignavibacteriaceae bacterium]HRP91293.1 HAD-IA family hydrolase [Ignavibacteriaceae bacterium]